MRKNWKKLVSLVLTAACTMVVSNLEAKREAKKS